MNPRMSPVALLAATAVAAALVPAVTADATSEPPRAAAVERAPTARPALHRVGHFNDPVYLTGAPKDRRRLFVVEQAGRIRIVRDGRELRKPFLDIAARVRPGGEQGLLSMAFSPGYARNRRFYVHYTGNDGDNRVVEFRRSRSNPDRAIRSSARVVLRIRQPQPIHNGGQLQFGPDGMLYVSTGDGGGPGDPGNNGQDRKTLLGKILRINPTRAGRRPYTVPRGNPFVGGAGRREVYAYGLRNPWRFSFDRRTGAMIVADVGQSTQEEINFAAPGRGRGANYGWSVWEGTRRFSSGRARGAVFPVKTLAHDDGYCAVVGGYVVRDRALAGLYGRYVYGDLCRSTIRSVVLGPGSATGDRSTGLRVKALVSFGEDTAGHVYAVTIPGRVYRLG